jgi:hypothetical protein
MADSQDRLKYLKEAFMEPVNFWGMAGFAVAAAYVCRTLSPLAAALARRNALPRDRAREHALSPLVDRVKSKRLLKLRDKQREAHDQVASIRASAKPSSTCAG